MGNHHNYRTKVTVYEENILVMKAISENFSFTVTYI